MDPEKKLTIRIIASVASFLLFTVLAVSAALTHAMDAQMPIIFGLLLLSMFVMPRQIPRPQGADQEKIDRAARMQIWLAYTRVAYFLTALIVLFGLPKLID